MSKRLPAVPLQGPPCCSPSLSLVAVMSSLHSARLSGL